MKRAAKASIAAAILSVALTITIMVIFTTGVPPLPPAVRWPMRILQWIASFPAAAIFQLSGYRPWSENTWVTAGVNTVILFVIPPVFWGTAAFLVGKKMERNARTPNRLPVTD